MAAGPQGHQQIPQQDTVFFGTLYWRESWFGPGCPPAILFYRQGCLRLETATEVLFDAPVALVKIRLTALKSLIFQVQGREFAVIAKLDCYGMLRPVDVDNGPKCEASINI